MNKLKVVSEFEPRGDQPQAIEALCSGLQSKRKQHILKGVTGSGKTYVMANVIEKTQRPALIITHNKTLVGQLYQEFRSFFPNNAVEYFVSYYDYYQPEASFQPATFSLRKTPRSTKKSTIFATGPRLLCLKEETLFW